MDSDEYSHSFLYVKLDKHPASAIFFFFFINHLLPGLPTRLYVPLQMWDPGYIALLNICIQYKHYSYKFIQVSQVGKK